MFLPGKTKALRMDIILQINEENKGKKQNRKIQNDQENLFKWFLVCLLFYSIFQLFLIFSLII